MIPAVCYAPAYILCRATFALQQQNLVVSTEIVWPAKLKKCLSSDFYRKSLPTHNISDNFFVLHVMNRGQFNFTKSQIGRDEVWI